MTHGTGSMHRLQARSTYYVLAAVIIASANAAGYKFPFDESLTAEVLVILAPPVLAGAAWLERKFGTKRLYWFRKKSDGS